MISELKADAGEITIPVSQSSISDYVAKLKTPLRNSGKIVEGQSVNLSLEDFPKSEFGIIKGTVSKISSMPSEEGFYLIDVYLPDNLITSYNKKITFKYEMRSKAEIITEDLRLLERILYQFKDILDY